MHSARYLQFDFYLLALGCFDLENHCTVFLQNLIDSIYFFPACLGHSFRNLILAVHKKGLFHFNLVNQLTFGLRKRVRPEQQAIRFLCIRSESSRFSFARGHVVLLNNIFLLEDNNLHFHALLIKFLQRKSCTGIQLKTYLKVRFGFCILLHLCGVVICF